MLRAPLVLFLLVLNLSVWGNLVFLGGLVKFATRGAARNRVILALAWLAERWVICNDLIVDTFLDTTWDLDRIDELRHDGRYLVISNHISWIDIFAVLRAFRGRAPFIRFFLKRILLWFPFAGLGCWGLEFPFMRRYTPEYLARHPEKRGLDLETTKAFCRTYRAIPVTILNFIEGTRFTPEKHARQGSPFRRLLRPRIGGVGFVLASMGDQLDAVYDVTIAYPDRRGSVLGFLSNRLPRVVLRARRLEVPPAFLTSTITEPGPDRDAFRQWIEQIWREKDELLGRMV